MKRNIAAIWLSLTILLSFVVIVIDMLPISTAQTTIYVDDVPGSGGPGDPPEDYASIQDAIDAANPGDTIFVYNGSYLEHIIIDKTINLMGESTNGVKIDGGNSGVVVYVTVDFVNISTLTVTGCGSDWRNSGIELNNVQNINIINCNISDNPCLGIDLYYTIGANLLNNTFSNNNNRGLYFYYADEIIMENNTISNNGFMGIDLLKSNNNHFFNNRITNNTDVGLLMSQSSNNTFKFNYIYNNTSDGLEITTFCNDNVVTNNTAVKNGKAGIALMEASINNLVANNKATSNWDGFYFYNAVSNTVINNTFSNNRWIGVNIQGCNNNIISNNIASNNLHLGFLIDQSLSAVSHHNTISNNVANNNDWVGIYLYDSENNTVKKNNVYGNDEGIRALNSHYNTISFNNVLSNNYGVTFDSSYYNNLTDNNILDSDYGLMIWGSEENRIHNNKFINSKFRHVHSTDGCSHNNIWNDSNERGNYWSDYTGSDDGSGGRIAGDGVGDTLIPHPFTDQGFGYYQLDNYPLIKNLTILKQGWNLISIPLIQQYGTLTEVLSSIEGYYDVVQWYDSNDLNDQWKHHKVSKPFGNDLFELNVTMGFWIHIIQPGGILFLHNGTQPTQNQSIKLSPGWNLVGYPSLSNKNRTTALNNITFNSDVDAIWTYNAASQKWEKMGETDFFEIGKGYYIHSKVKKTWEVPL